MSCSQVWEEWNWRLTNVPGEYQSVMVKRKLSVRQTSLRQGLSGTVLPTVDLKADLGSCHGPGSFFLVPQ